MGDRRQAPPMAPWEWPDDMSEMESEQAPEEAGEEEEEEAAEEPQPPAPAPRARAGARGAGAALSLVAVSILLALALALLRGLPAAPALPPRLPNPLAPPRLVPGTGRDEVLGAADGDAPDAPERRGPRPWSPARESA